MNLRHDKKTHKTFLRPTPVNALHYYFYFFDEEVGLCYLPNFQQANFIR